MLDVMMPELDGFTLCRRLREKYTFPIIMLTAREEEIDKITGLAIGADDYVTKPFRPLELVARVKAQLRRSQRYNGGQQEAGAIAAYRGLTLNRETHVCTLDEKPVELTPIEFSIPVSYTHLDVYKRQIFSRTTRANPWRRPLSAGSIRKAFPATTAMSRQTLRPCPAGRQPKTERSASHDCKTPEN